METFNAQNTIFFWCLFGNQGAFWAVEKKIDRVCFDNDGPERQKNVFSFSWSGFSIFFHSIVYCWHQRRHIVGRSMKQWWFISKHTNTRCGWTKSWVVLWLRSPVGRSSNPCRDVAHGSCYVRGTLIERMIQTQPTTPCRSLYYTGSTMSTRLCILEKRT